MSTPTPDEPYAQRLTEAGWQYGGEDENGLEHWSLTVPWPDETTNEAEALEA